MNRLLVTLFVSALSPALALASDPGSPDAWHHERREERFELAAGGAVQVENPHGDLRVRGWEHPRAELVAHLQAPPGAPLPELELTHAEDLLTLTVDEHTDRARVDLTLLVPMTSSLQLSSRDGLIEVKGVRGHIVATSFAGRLRINCGPSCSLESAQGTIQAALESPGASGPWSMRSVTGSIAVDLGANPNLEAHVVTKGTIGSDYSMTVEPTGNGRQKRALIQIGAGRARLELSSERGDISVTRSDFRVRAH